MTNDRIALVTGASRGIGAAIARRLASDGFSVVVNYSGSEQAAADLVKEIETGGGRSIAVRADVSQADEVAKLFDQAEETFGIPTVLVNSAGVMQLASMSESSDELFDRTVAINFRGTFNTLREAARRMRDGGRIINLSTSVVGLNLPGYSIYAATKAAVETMTAILAKEMRGRSITVNAVAPGPTATSLFLDGKTEEQVERLAKMNPMERLATPEDIANTVSFLAGPDGGWINGQTLRANGGMV